MRLVQVTDRALDVADHLAAVSDDRCGAVVTFVGQVRDHDPEVTGTVTAIQYSAHPDAQQILARIVTDVSAAGRDPVQVAVSHRTGDLTVGELALVVCVAAAHRDRAYEISRTVVERIKKELPVWKKQHTSDGNSRWSGL